METESEAQGEGNMADRPKRQSYKMVSIEQRLLAVEIVERLGGRITDATLKEVRNVLNLPTLDASNLRKWVWTYKGVKRVDLPTTDRGRMVIPRESYNEDGTMVVYDPNERKVVEIDENNGFRKVNLTKMAGEARSKADELYAQIAEKYLEHALKDEVIAQMKGREAVQAAALAYDRLSKSENQLPLEVAVLIPLIVAELERLKQDPYKVFYSMYMSMRKMEPKSDGDNT